MRSGPAADSLVAELGAEAWANAVGSRPCRVVHRRQAPMARRARARQRPPHGGRLPSPRLAHLEVARATDSRPRPSFESLATDRSDASGTGLLVVAHRGVPPDLLRAGPRARRRGSPRARTVPRAPAGDGAVVFGPGRRRQRRRPRSCSARRRVTSSSRSGPPARSRPAARSLCPTAPGPSRASPTPRASYLPLVCTVNAARVLEAVARMLGVDQQALLRPGALGPAGMRTDSCSSPTSRESARPTCPTRRASCTACSHKTSTPAHLARAAVEGLLCGLADALDAVESHGRQRRASCTSIGGGAPVRSPAPDRPGVFGRPVLVPPAGEYVADGAAYQASWVLDPDHKPAPWSRRGTPSSSRPKRRPRSGPATREVRDEYIVRWAAGQGLATDGPRQLGLRPDAETGPGGRSPECPHASSCLKRHNLALVLGQIAASSPRRPARSWHRAPASRRRRSRPSSTP